MPSRRVGSTPDRQSDNQYGKCVTAELAYMRGYEVTTEDRHCHITLEPGQTRLNMRAISGARTRRADPEETR